MDIFRSFWGCLDVFRKSLPMYPLSVDDRKRAAENVDTFETFSHGRLPLSSQSSRQAAVTGATWTRAILAHTPTGDFFEFLQLSLVIFTQNNVPQTWSWWLQWWHRSYIGSPHRWTCEACDNSRTAKVELVVRSSPWWRWSDHDDGTAMLTKAAKYFSQHYLAKAPPCTATAFSLTVNLLVFSGPNQ